MSFNIYNKFSGPNATFQSNLHPHFVPPPPLPPQFFIPPIQHFDKPDQVFVKEFESKICTTGSRTVAVKSLPISVVREELRKIITAVNGIKEKEKVLSENMQTLTEDEWRFYMQEIEEHKKLIDAIVCDLSGTSLDALRRQLAKRAAKRLRLKKVRTEIKKEKEEKRKESEEISRKIEENLRRIKDDIIKAQQEDEAKLEADLVLRDVRRRKLEGKKYIAKLDALVELHRARQNTAKGRGETVSEAETAAFHKSIDQLKSQWNRQLATYDAEEAELQAKLEENSGQQVTFTSMTERQVANTLGQWKQALFGGQLPQADFRGNHEHFIAVRSQWDRYIDCGGTALPMGWVPPSRKEQPLE